jgi:predicted transposase/invertase (TIGR01784 family)
MSARNYRSKSRKKVEKARFMDKKRRLELRRKIKEMTLMDDCFMTVCLRDNLECVQLMLRIIVKKSDLVVTNVTAQEPMKNLQGRSVTFDVTATDSAGKLYDIEIQGANQGAGRKRARYHSGMLDSHALDFGQPFDALPETWVVFITKGDPLGKELPIYHIERVILETGELFNDETHIVYVNGSCIDSNTDLGKLVHDLSCNDPDKMYFKLIADTVRYHKEDEEGLEIMAETFDEWLDDWAKEITDEVRQKALAEGRAEGRAEARKDSRKNLKKTREQIAQKLIQAGVMTIEDIADAAGLTVKTVQKLAEKKAA